jgi:Polycystin cation channel
MSHSMAADSILVENQIIGLPRIRLLRVDNQSCEVNTDFRSIVGVCYGGYSQANEDQSSYGPANSSALVKLVLDTF